MFQGAITNDDDLAPAFIIAHIHKYIWINRQTRWADVMVQIFSTRLFSQSPESIGTPYTCSGTPQRSSLCCRERWLSGGKNGRAPHLSRALIVLINYRACEHLFRSTLSRSFWKWSCAPKKRASSRWRHIWMKNANFITPHHCLQSAEGAFCYSVFPAINHFPLPRHASFSSIINSAQQN